MLYSRRAAFAQSTTGNIKSQCKAFLLFTKFFNLQSWPAELDTICLFAQFLSRSFSSVESIKNYISGVKLVHLLMDLPFPHVGKIELKLVIRGLARLNPFTPRQALPITPEILLDMYKVLDINNNILHATLWCCFLLGFYLFARKSNLVPVSAPKFSQKKHLCRRDIMVAKDHLVVYIKWTKTIQHGQRYLLIPLAQVPGSPLCPRAAFINMCKLMPASGSQPAFLFPHNGKIQILTHAAFTRHLRHFLRLAGHEPKGYSGHSFRRGGATYALKIGVPGELIRAHGDWRSDSYLKYFDLSLDHRAKVSRIMSNKLSRLSLAN